VRICWRRAAASPDAILVPKVESPEDIVAVEDALEQTDAPASHCGSGR
jgi:citrate lyase beta subunit